MQGSGYLTACFAHAVQPGGLALGIERHPGLAEASIRNLRSAVPKLIESGAVIIRVGNILGGAILMTTPAAFSLSTVACF